MSTPKPVTAIITFQLQPGSRNQWLELWKRAQQAAQIRPSCRRFRLLYNLQDEDECVVLSEWDSAADLDSFARDTGLIWIDRGSDRMCDVPRYAIYREVQSLTELTVLLQSDRQLTPAGR